MRIRELKTGEEKKGQARLEERMSVRGTDHTLGHPRLRGTTPPEPNYGWNILLSLLFPVEARKFCLSNVQVLGLNSCYSINNITKYVLRFHWCFIQDSPVYVSWILRLRFRNRSRALLHMLLGGYVFRATLTGSMCAMYSVNMRAIWGSKLSLDESMGIILLLANVGNTLVGQSKRGSTRIRTVHGY